MQPANFRPLKMLLVAPPERIRQGILSRLYAVSSVLVMGQIGSLDEYPPVVATGQADVIVVDAGELEGFDYDQLARLLRQQPDLTVAVVAARHRRGALDRFYRAGVRCFITEDVGMAALIDTLVTISTRPCVFLVRMGG